MHCGESQCDRHSLRLHHVYQQRLIRFATGRLHQQRERGRREILQRIRRYTSNFLAVGHSGRLLGNALLLQVVRRGLHLLAYHLRCHALRCLDHVRYHGRSRHQHQRHGTRVSPRILRRNLLGVIRLDS